MPHKLKCECGNCQTCYWREYWRKRRLKDPNYGKARQQRWREANRTRVRAYAKTWLAARPGYDEQRRKLNPEKARQSVRKYHERYPDRYKARGALGTAIKSGKIKREPCEVCGDPKSQGHHDDYSKPLEVRWLCQRCHAAVHMELKEKDDDSKNQEPHEGDKHERLSS